MNDYVAARMRSVFHIESRHDIQGQLRAGAADFDFVSGHIALPHALTILKGRAHWFIFTLLRNPVQHVISLLKWNKAFGHPSRRSELLQHPEPTQEVCRLLQDIDLDNIDKIARLLDSVDQARRFFDNCQVRYLGGQIDGFVGPGNVSGAIEISQALDYIGFCDDAARSASTALGLAGWPDIAAAFPRSNPSPIRELPNFKDPAVLNFYRHLVRHDTTLYIHLRDRKWSRPAAGVQSETMNPQ